MVISQKVAGRGSVGEIGLIMFLQIDRIFEEYTTLNIDWNLFLSIDLRILF